METLLIKNGEITLPILGKVSKWKALTVSEAPRYAVNKKAGEYSERIYGSGKAAELINSPCSVSFVHCRGLCTTITTTSRFLEAISRAGGVTDFSRLNRIMVVRTTSAGYKSFKIDLASVRNCWSSEAFYLQPDDIVYAGPDKNKNISLNSSHLLPVVILLNNPVGDHAILQTLISNTDLILRSNQNPIYQNTIQ